VAKSLSGSDDQNDLSHDATACLFTFFLVGFDLIVSILNAHADFTGYIAGEIFWFVRKAHEGPAFWNGLLTGPLDCGAADLPQSELTV